jgi:hypothetical protein
MIPDVQNLADRLLVRGRTTLSDVPERQGDLHLAAKALLAMTRSFHQSVVLMLDCT